jgi:hypothetical protein
MQEKGPDGIAVRVVEVIQVFNAQTGDLIQRSLPGIIHHRNKSADLGCISGNGSDEVRARFFHFTHIYPFVYVQESSLTPGISGAPEPLRITKLLRCASAACLC